MNSIAKRDYYLKALRAGCYCYKQWILEAFTQVDNLGKEPRDFPYALFKDAKGYYFFDFEKKDGEAIYLEGTFKTHGPFQLMERMNLVPGDLENVSEPIETCYGNALVNATVLIYAFGSKVSFMTGPLTVAGIERKIEPRLISNHEKPQGAKNLTIGEYKRFNEGFRHLDGLSQICVPSATPKTLTIDKSVLKRRDELLKEYKDRIDDPLVQAHITEELVKLDRASFKGDPAERFYLKSKSFEVIRKRMHIFVGEESGFGKKGSFIPTSLSEGWNIEELPSMSNAMREGSFNRGSRTALGGVEAKNNYRIFQNTVVAEEDCGTKLGLRITLSAFMAKYWIGMYVINSDETLTEITHDNYRDFIDKAMVVRSPAYCKTAKQNLCAKCVGSQLAKTPTAISTFAADVGSTFLQTLLASAHRVALKSHKFSYVGQLH
jgi:hypothetical protein